MSQAPIFSQCDLGQPFVQNGTLPCGERASQSKNVEPWAPSLAPGVVKHSSSTLPGHLQLFWDPHSLDFPHTPAAFLRHPLESSWKMIAQ